MKPVPTEKQPVTLPFGESEITISRARLACLLRRWRSDPATPKEIRNYATTDDLASMLLAGEGGAA